MSGVTARERELLATAAQLFAQQGYPGTSMSQLAAACGLSKPALYHYVPDKAELLARICEAHVEKLAALVREVEAQAQATTPVKVWECDGYGSRWTVSSQFGTARRVRMSR